jgi:hypothetical protein
MAKELRVFISHRMPTDTAIAEQIGSRLALYAGNQVKVTHAGQFRYGDKWRNKIKDELDTVDWLIFLYTDQDEDWGFCLFECGYFQARMEKDPENKQLVIFCRQADQISPALREFNAMEAGLDSILKLLKDIYHREPWAISPAVSEEDLRKTAAEILDAFTGGARIEANFDVATSVTFEFVMTEQNATALKHGRLPADCAISGTRDWQRLFGKDINTGGWQWRNLVEDWPYREIYEFLIASMIHDAANGRNPHSTVVRPPNSDELYRLTLRRYERIAGQKKRFFFTLTPLDLPFEVSPESGQKAKETVLYHLLTLSWFFRRRIVDRLYDRVLQVLAMHNPDMAIVNTLFDEIRYELMDISAQAIIRGIDNPLSLQRAFGDDDSEVKALLNRLESWREQRQRIFKSMERGAKGLPDIANDLYEMAMQTHDFYRKVAVGYSAIAQRTLPPSPPQDRGEKTSDSLRKPAKRSRRKTKTGKLSHGGVERTETP